MIELVQIKKLIEPTIDFNHLLHADSKVIYNDFRKKMFNVVSEKIEEFSDYLILFEIVKDLEFNQKHLYHFKVGEKDVKVIAVK